MPFQGELPTMQLHFLTMLAMSAVALSSTATGFILSNGKCLAPSPCTCSGNNYVYCQGKSLTDVPRFIPTNSTEHVSSFYIYLYINKLTTVPNNAFKNLSSINTTQLNIQLYSNKISSIGRKAFAGVENKTYSIDLNNNNLKSLPSALSTVISLRVLEIQGNPLKSLDPSVTSHLSNSLYTFAFYMGAFQSWPYELRYFNHLRALIINIIPFSHVPLNAFDGLGSSLMSLTMSYTQLPRIPSAICHLKNLQTLHFSYNTKLESNSSLFEPCQHKLVNLLSLNFQSNRLTSFPDVLYSFPNVSLLDLYANQIRFIHTKTVPFHNKIVTLNLNYNRLSQIPFAVNKMKHLRTLELVHNEIVTVEDNDLTGLANLYDLQLYNNPIEYVAPRAFTNNHLLSYVQLQNTNLTTVPQAVLSIPKLSNFAFTGNHVKCTCDMAYLKSLNATKISTIDGNCENQPSVPIKQYISTNLQGCP